MAVERIDFICDVCRAKTFGDVTFTYETKTEWKREWILHKDREYCSGISFCKRCGHKNQVWPTFHEELRWEKRNGKAK